MRCIDLENYIVSSKPPWEENSTNFVTNRIDHEPKMWDNLKAQFMNHIPAVNETLRNAGLPEMGVKE